MQTQTFHALRYGGNSFDCGSDKGFVAANIAMALESPSLRAHMTDIVADAVRQLGGTVQWPTRDRSEQSAVSQRGDIMRTKSISASQMNTSEHRVLPFARPSS